MCLRCPLGLGRGGEGAGVSQVGTQSALFSGRSLSLAANDAANSAQDGGKIIEQITDSDARGSNS